MLELIPAALKEAFESRDTEKLHKVLFEMKPSEAKKWMKMCVDSGLWVPQNEEIFDDMGEEGDEEEEEEKDIQGV